MAIVSVASASSECSATTRVIEDSTTLLQSFITQHEYVDTRHTQHGDECGMSGSSRRRCDRTNSNCVKSTTRRCRFFAGTPRVLTPGDSCSWQSKTCGRKKFCGISKTGVINLTLTASGITPLSCCFRREGGYGDVPAWYKNRDFRNIHKCIDDEMLREITVCGEETKRKESEKRAEFIHKMNQCAVGHGYSKFSKLSKVCGSPDVLGKMEQCRDSVTAEMRGLPAPAPTPITLETTTSTPGPTLTTTIAFAPAPPAQCGMSGGSRRRCKRTNSNCLRDSDRRCKYFSPTPRILQPTDGCSAFAKTCGSNNKFCGISKAGVIELTTTMSGRTPLSCCFGREGGYGGVPAWYKYKDYRNIHKCIDGEMQREMTVCVAEVRKTEKEKRSEFMDRMDRCAVKHGAKSFRTLSASCRSPDVLRKMEECRDNVTSDMMALRPPGPTPSPASTATTAPPAAASTTETTTTGPPGPTPSPASTATTAPPAAASTTETTTTGRPGSTAPPAPSQCGVSGNSRRRCQRTNQNCLRSTTRTCRFFARTPRVLKPGDGCSAFAKTCGTSKFCGITRTGVIDLTMTMPGRTPLSCCFGREGGYSKLPAWYANRDYRNIHKCIDAEMKDEIELCGSEVEKREKDKRREFMDRMDKCAVKHGMKSFNQLAKSCRNPNVLSQMEECRSNVTTEMMESRFAGPTPSPGTATETTTAEPATLAPTPTTSVTETTGTATGTSEASTTPPVVAPVQCGVEGYSRRRCTRTNSNCLKSTTARCRFFSLTPRLLEPGDGCSAYSRDCRSEKFCGITRSGLINLTLTSSGRSPLSCCFGREGGYGKLPSWYTNKDYRNIHKCIDQEMLDEMTVCSAEAKELEAAKRDDFKERMDACAKKHGAESFKKLCAGCHRADILGKMKECRAEVMSHMEGLRPPEAPPASTTRTTSTPGDTGGLWPQYGPDKRKCGGVRTVKVADQNECQRRAAGLGMYMYLPAKDLCGVFASCDKVVRTNADWKMYGRDFVPAGMQEMGR